MMKRCKHPLVYLAGLVLAASVSAQDDLQNIPDPDPQLQEEALHTADGFAVNLFASDPMIDKPIQMNWDAEGRLWVATSTVYPQLQPGQEPDDKVFVLEDTNGDGRADESTVFADGLLTPTGLIPGDGGVYVANSTEILHLKDTDGDGRADERRVVLSGFGTDDTHHLIHTFRWGPEARLYFNQSIYIYSNVETPWGIRRLHGGGIWQLRPESLQLDVYARGLINPWGLQFDDWGQSFATDGAGRQGINYAFPGAAFVAAKEAERTLEGLNPGQPKHSGLAILAGRHLPDSLHGDLITNDFRANTVNRFILTEDGSGYASKRAEDLVWTDHVAFRPVDVTMGPDGAIYIADWYNPIIQHGEVDFRDRRRDHRHGRIWRITAEDRPLVEPPELAGADTKQLLDALKLPERWTRTQAKQLLKERGAEAVLPVLKDWVRELDRSDPGAQHHLLEALWVTQAVGAANQPLLTELLASDDHRARAAAVRVLSDWSDQITRADERLADAAMDEHPRVRREAVTALQERQTAEAARTAMSVLEQPMDEFLDFALWSTTRELAPYWMPQLEDNPDYFGSVRKLAYVLKSVDDSTAVRRLAQMYRNGKVPADYEQDVLDAIAGRGSADDLQVVFDLALQKETMPEANPEVLWQALEEAARRRDVQPSGDLDQLQRVLDADAETVRPAVVRLAGLWERTHLRGHLESLVRDENQPEKVQQAGLEGLALLGDEQSKQALVEMAASDRSPAFQMAAVSTLASVDRQLASQSAVEVLRDAPTGTDPSAMFEALLARGHQLSAFAEALEDEPISEEMAKAGMEVVRSKGDRWLKANADAERIKIALEAAGGILPPPRMPQDLSEAEVNQLMRDVRETADPEHGENIYRRASLMCMSCHAIGGAGGQVGPDLSSIGASAPMDYIIEALISPDNAVKDGYALVEVTKTDGSVASGMLVRETGSEVVLRNAADQETSISAGQIQRREIQRGSLMPPGLTAQLSRDEFIDLVGFLSELGEPGDYRVARNRLVRRWQVLPSSDALHAALREEGLSYVADEGAALPWQSTYSTVAGDLPLEDVPEITPAEGERYGFARFALDVETAGRLQLAFSSPAGLSIRAGQEPLEPVTQQMTLDLPAGRHAVVLAIDRDERGGTPLQVELSNVEGSPARAQIVAGK